MRVSDLVSPPDAAASAPSSAAAKDAHQHQQQQQQQPLPHSTKQTAHHTHVFQLSGADPRARGGDSRAFAHQPVHYGNYRNYTAPGAPPPPSPPQYQGTQYTFQSIQNPPQQVIQFQQHHPAQTPVIRRRRPQSQSVRSLDSPETPANHSATAPAHMPPPPPPTFRASQDTPGSLNGTRVASADNTPNGANASGTPNTNGNVSIVPGNRSFPCPLSIYGCTSTFGSKNEWKRHVNTQHMRMGFWRCDMCKTGERKPNDFNRKDLFIQHVRRMHPMSATSPATAGLPAPSKSSKDGEDMQMLQNAAARCYKALRHPPEASCCLFCDRTFQGDGTWDDRMEHVGRHLELMRRANEQPPESKDWRPDEAMEKWLASYQIIVPNGSGGFVLDDQQLTQKPPRRTSSVSQLPQQLMNPALPISQAPPLAVAQPKTSSGTLNASLDNSNAKDISNVDPSLRDDPPRQKQYLKDLLFSNPQPASAPAPEAEPSHRIATQSTVQPSSEPIEKPAPPPTVKSTLQSVVQPAAGASLLDKQAPQSTKSTPQSIKPASQAAPKSVSKPASKPAPKPVPERQSSPDRLFSAFDEPTEQSVKGEAEIVKPNGVEETEAQEILVATRASTRGKAKRSAAKKQAAAGAEEEDPYLSLFQTMPDGDESRVAEAKEDEAGSSMVVGGKRKRGASPAPSMNSSFYGGLKDRIYSGFQKAVLGMASSVQRLFVEPTDATEGEDQSGELEAAPVAKRTRTARAQEKAANSAAAEEDNGEHAETGPPPKKQRRGRKPRVSAGPSAARESSTSSRLSMTTRSSGRVRDNKLQKSVISSRS